MKFREDNRGVTLIELMLSVSLIVIIMGCMVILMSNAGKGYARGSIQVTLQEESQDAMNYITDSVLWCNYAEVTTGAAVTALTLYDFDESDKTDLTKSPRRVFAHYDNKLYFFSVGDAATQSFADKVVNNSASLTSAEIDSLKGYQLCTNVDVFNADFDVDKGLVSFALELSGGGKPVFEYKTDNAIAIRNMMVEP